MNLQLEFLILFVTTIIISACATSTKSVMLGASSGAAAGAGIGVLVDPGPKGHGRIKNAYVGAAAGAVLGGAAGYLIHDSMEARESAAFEKGKSEGLTKLSQVSSNGNPPNLIPPKVEVRFVDDQVKGNSFIPAHFEYIILEPARWNN
jgi:outer membrane lipoprotein SlyB